jgi:two-component system, LytTR family, sensor kinase
MFATQLYLAERRLAERPYTWWESVRADLPDWYIWGLFALLVARLAQRVPIDRVSWGFHFAFHVAASLLVALAHLSVAVSLQWVIRSLGGEPYPILSKFVDNFAVFYLWNVVVYWAILAVVHTGEYRRTIKQRDLRATQLEASVAEVRLQALTLQLRPHFLFNTLNAIAELIHEDPDAAERMVGRLADLLRRTLETDGSVEVPLATELELVNHYLEIEAVRFQDRLRVSWEIANEARSAAVPAMILLPLVENAVRHGVASRPGPGQVGICARRDNGTLRVEVWDDGPGLDEEAASGTRRGIGLANTRARLLQLYGASHRLELVDGTLGGLVVRLSLPFHLPQVA